MILKRLTFNNTYLVTNYFFQTNLVYKEKTLRFMCEAKMITVNCISGYRTDSIGQHPGHMVLWWHSVYVSTIDSARRQWLHCLHFTFNLLKKKYNC